MTVPLPALGTIAWSQVTQPWMLYPVFALLGAARRPDFDLQRAFGH